MPESFRRAIYEFQSTPSARRATARCSRSGRRLRHFNPRPPRGERRLILLVFLAVTLFQSTPSARRATGLFSPKFKLLIKFQSTPSARRATTRHGQSCKAHPYFNPRPPRGERPGFFRSHPARIPISIHALREESDLRCERAALPNPLFQSTPSARRATHKTWNVRDQTEISIHALREESDLVVLFLTRMPPKFQSTPSARRATRVQPHREQCSNISIHALREESDAGIHGVASTSPIFQSTPSARRAT